MSHRDRMEWAAAKIARAQQHRHDLQGRIAAWSAIASPHSEASIAEDRLGYEVRIRMKHAPPLPEWSLIVGDSLHNLRSALDVLVWALADVERLSPGQRTSLMWPVISEPDLWADAVARRLPSVSARFVERIRECQPLIRPVAERARDGLSVLHRLDIQDKHRLALSVEAQMTGLGVDQAVEFHSDSAAERNVPPDVTLASEPPTADGVTLLRGRTRDPIKKIKGSINLTYRVGLTVEGEFIGLFDLLDGLTQHVAQAVAHVATAAES